MSKQTQLLLCQYFQQLAASEVSSDNIKQQLQASKEFDAQKLFNAISSNQNYITPVVLRGYLQSKLRVNQNELYMIFSKFDHELQGTINLNEFQKQLVPLMRKGGKSERLNSDPSMVFLSLLQEWIDKERLLNIHRRDLESIIPYQMFDLIATEQKGYISKNELEVFLNRNEINQKEKFIDYLIYGLKRRSHFKITLECFCENLNPLQFGYYRQYKESVAQQQIKQSKKRNEEEEQKIKELKEHEQRIQNEARKERRRQQAENQKQMEIEMQLKKEAQKAREQSERLLRKAVLEAEKLQRLEMQKQKLILQDQIKQNEIQKRRLEELRILNHQEVNEGRYLEQKIVNNEIELSSTKKRIQQQQMRLLEVEKYNDINRQNIQIGLRRDRCFSDVYSAQRTNYLHRDAELERIRRETALAMAQRQQNPQTQLFLNLDRPIERTHIYRPQSTFSAYSPYTNLNPVASVSYGNSLNTTSKLRNSGYERPHHSLMKDTFSPIRNIQEKSVVQKQRTPSEVRSHQLDRSREDLQLKKRRLEDEIRTATGRKHPYV